MSLIIVRPTVIFGEGNRGNVYNLFKQIASNKFLMVGDGNNKKSLAYIGNVVAFLATCISSDVKYGLYNYTDSPDLTMNELVSHVRKMLLGQEGTGLRLPVWLGMLAGYVADGFRIFGYSRIPISSVRIKKFISDSQFSSSKNELEGFEPPFLLLEGINRTLKSEFIDPDAEREIFFTE